MTDHDIGRMLHIIADMQQAHAVGETEKFSRHRIELSNWIFEHGLEVALEHNALSQDALRHLVGKCPRRLKGDAISADGSNLNCPDCRKRWSVQRDEALSWLLEQGPMGASEDDLEFARLEALRTPDSPPPAAAANRSGGLRADAGEGGADG